ncbi:hypothetical protein [Clostridium thermopalmarium]|uniref:Uncharacterized protein n=1 Tax=Clostridium thermopalmarium DSM 5974 TaxID=1121340 RepID=A0A2T0APV7_9CLOT|nr:hypothetical protein [Clostridium thermopalmarium]MBE6042935.1 hypothetical protein [Clostridium thermopalmarium]PRR71046.1 hypothetical protein CPAL_21460 [Clostridium thermopalmarium DSM 5974]PVZ23615.1 hypothetical protein LX19_01513 [Clostridium thermopalmarium DSM 5974]
MSRRCKCGCACGYPARVAGVAEFPVSGCGGFDPCRLALFLLILKRACIIDHETATILIFLFLLCCRGFGSRSICAGGFGY